MSATIVSVPQTLAPRTSQPVALLEVGPRRWRVIDRRGRALGHLDALDRDGRPRYRARRFHAPTRDFRDLGDFWSVDEAVECLRYSR